MASKAKRQTEDRENEALFIGRFVHDVLVYTLTKCGLPETSLPTTDCAENVYHNADFVKVAGASTLRISLVMRDKWKRMFKSRHSSSGFTSKGVPEFLMRLVICCPVSRESNTQAVVELLLASCNEIIMYLHSENIDIDFKILIKAVSEYIIGIIGVDENDYVKLEEFFDQFDDISEYTEWITDFITKFATPYGSRDDVSDLFIERVTEQYKDNLKKARDRVKNSLKFLPHDLFSAITDEGPEYLAAPIPTPSDRESLDPLKLPTGSEMDAVEGKKFSSCQSTCAENVSGQFSQSKRSSQRSSEVGIEQDLGKMSLDAKEDSQKMHGPKLKTAPNEKDIGRKES